MKQIRSAVVAVVAALVSLTAACGSDGGRSAVKALSPLAKVLAAADKTAEAKTSRMSMTAKITSEGQTVDMTADGVFHLVEMTGQMRVSMPEAAGIPIGEMEMRFVDNVLFMKYPDQMAQFFGGKSWVKLDLSSGDFGDMTQLAQTQSANPAQGLSMMEGAESVTEKGAEKVRGVDTTRYTVVLDMNKAMAEAATPEEREALKTAVDLFGGEQMTMDLWLDEEGVARRFHYIMDLGAVSDAVSGVETEASGAMDVTVELYDFGAPLDVKAPPADEVTDLAELMAHVGDLGAAAAGEGE